MEGGREEGGMMGREERGARREQGLTFAESGEGLLCPLASWRREGEREEGGMMGREERGGSREEGGMPASQPNSWPANRLASRNP